jgi:catechol 2,3-dioxygenase-like lactoylglutathione lyase family enzyme
MAINGIAVVVYAVKDLDAGIRFYEDFGLTRESREACGAEFSLPEGSRVRLRRLDDASLPPSYENGPGVRQLIWGVDSREHLERLEKNLRADREVKRDSEGTICFTDDIGLPVGLMLFTRTEPSSGDDAVNAPGHARRKNQARKWYPNAKPQSIQHAVFFVPDVQRGMRFYCERLGFRISDISRGRGILARCEGRHDHHNLFFMQSDSLRFQHIAFDVQSIDELMAGAAYMQRRGWKSQLGLGRHRISSSIFYYIQNPCGESEYSADTDYVDDAWRPGIWDPRLAKFHWMGERAAFSAEALPEDFHILDRLATVDDYHGVHTEKAR